MLLINQCDHSVDAGRSPYPWGFHSGTPRSYVKLMIQMNTFAAAPPSRGEGSFTFLPLGGSRSPAQKKVTYSLFVKLEVTFFYAL